VAGFYDGLIAFNEHMIATGFIRPQHSKILIIGSELDALLTSMIAYQPHETIFRMTAALL
jgi:predicted Rossmann-fold nucleotide-binding protein